MKQWLLATAACLALALWLGSVLLERSARRAATDNGALRDFHDFTAEQLDRTIRSNLPAGTNRASAEDFLRQEGMRFSFDPAPQTLVANAPWVKGSSFFVYSSLGFTVHLDELSQVESIDSKVKLTGV